MTLQLIQNAYQILGTAVTCQVAIAWFLSTAIVLSQYYNVCFQPDDRVNPVSALELCLEYDFIVVGGGTAGAVVANRLSEIAEWKVLLIESGVDETGVSDVPILSGYFQQSPMDWDYKTEPSTSSCLAMKDNRCVWSRGRGLGGTSAISNMLYVRGHKKDYDGWAALGNSGWSYNDVLPYFKKSEDNKNCLLASNPYHGSGGYLTVSDPSYITPLATAFVEAGVDMGYENIDYNGDNQKGFRLFQSMTRNGKRCSTAKAFLRPVRHRPNLHVCTNSLVKKININPLTKVAQSVSILKDQILPLTIKAKKEIILSAGAINSAKLLMLSGVGPSAHLLSKGIIALKNLPVGQNLQDHVSFGGAIFKIDDAVSIIESQLFNVENFISYASAGTGPLTLLGPEATGFINTQYACASGNYPDIQIIFAPGSLLSDNGLCRKIQNLKEDFFNAVYGNNCNIHNWMAYPVLLRPKSKGSVLLKSFSIFDKPVINANYFSDPNDIAVLREGVKFILNLAKKPALQAFNSQFYDTAFPACCSFPFLSDGYIECAIRQYTHTFHHPVGTCKMGPISDPTSVVDAALNVIGIAKLRVIDASIMPTIVSGDCTASIIMIAEKACDLIKQAWNVWVPECTTTTTTTTTATPEPCL